MVTPAKIALLFGTLLFSLPALVQDAKAPGQAPQYTSDAQLLLPEHYRDWIYLSSGFDMSYSTSMDMDGHHMFDNVFVNPASYQAFLKTGTWPDKTMLVLEIRDARGKGSINQNGNYQGGVAGLEVHVKDESRFPDKWAFFGFDEGKTAKMILTTENCYSCHAEHAAVDTTFVQFYPTLLPIASTKGTLSAAYLKEMRAPAQKWAILLKLAELSLDPVFC